MFKYFSIESISSFKTASVARVIIFFLYSFAFAGFASAGQATANSPANGAFVSTANPVMTWDGTSGSFELQLATDAGFTDIIADSTTANNFYVSTASLNAGSYWWRVQEVGSPWSPTFSFVVDIVPPAYSGPQVSTSPAASSWTALPMATYLSTNVVSAKISVQDLSSGLLVSTGLPDGLVAQWHLDEGAGTVALDASPNAFNGNLINNPVWTSGVKGKALALNGTQEVDIPSADALNAYPLTASVWFKTNGSGSTTGAILSKYVSGYFNGYSVHMYGGLLCASYFINGNNQDYVDPDNDGYCGFRIPGFDDAQWHQAAFVVDSTGGNFYVDGLRRGYVAWNGNSGAPSTTEPLRLGAGFLGYFPGAIDEARLYNVARSSADILADYQSDTLAAHNRGQAYSVLYSTNAGSTWNYVSTNSVTLGGSNGTNALQTLEADNIPLVTSAGPGAPTNQIAFVTSDFAGNVSTAVYTVLVDTIPPTLLSPADTTYINAINPFMTWTGAIGNSRLQLARNPGFTDILADSTTANNFYISTNSLSQAATYWWRVQEAEISDLNVWSSTFSFMVDIASPVYSGPQVSTSPAGLFVSTAAYLRANPASIRVSVQDLNAGLLVSAGLFSSAVLPEGLIRQWRLDEGAGTLASDSSGNGADGTLVNGPAWVAGHRGMAVNFSGASRMDVPSITLGANYTVTAWSQFPLAAGGYHILMRMGYGDTHSPLCAYQNMLCEWPSGCTSGFDLSTLSGWHHLAAVASEGLTNFYVDGLNVGQVVGNAAGVTAQTAQFGGDAMVTSQVWGGALDDIRVYNVARSPAEILAEFQDKAYEVLYSTNAGGTWHLVSTDSVHLSGADGTKATQILEADNFPIVTSTEPGAPTNQIAFTVSDMAGNVSTAVYTVLGDLTGPPALAAPADAAYISTTNPAMLWTTGVIGDSRLQLATDEGFTNIIADSVTVNAFYASTGSLSNAAAYWWRVKAYDNLINEWTDWSSTFSFVVDIVPPVFSGPQVSTPAAPSWTNLPMNAYISTNVVSARISVQDLSAGLLVSTGLPDGLVAQWHLDEGTGTVALDASMSGNKGAFVGNPVWVAGKSGSALKFINDGDAMAVNQISMAGPYTLETWFQYPLPALSGADYWILTYGVSPTVHHIVVRYSDMELGVISSGFGDSGFNLGALSDGWHHLAAAAYGSQTDFYVDGSYRGTSNLKPAGAIDYIGGVPGQSRQFGAIDEFRVFNVARSPAQIMADYQSDTLAAHNRGQAYSVLYSTNAGATWNYVSTNSVTLGGSNGTAALQTLQADNIPVVTSTGPAASTNRIAFVASDFTGNVSAAVYTVLVDTSLVAVPVLSGFTVSSDTIHWLWQAAAGPAANFNFRTGTGSLVVSLPGSSNSYLETGLSTGTLYSRYIEVSNPSGQALSSTVTVATPDLQAYISGVASNTLTGPNGKTEIDIPTALLGAATSWILSETPSQLPLMSNTADLIAAAAAPAGLRESCSSLTEFIVAAGGVRYTGTLSAPVTVKVPYPDTNNTGFVDGISPPLRADTLRLYVLNETSGLWEAVPGSTVDRTHKVIIGQIGHLSIFTAFGTGAAGDLSALRVYPNPFKPNSGDPDNGVPYSAGNLNSGVIFDNLTEQAAIKIYTITGQLVARLSSENSGGRLQWDVKNDSGRSVASGGYIAVITSPGHSTVVKKILIVR
ncbi:MAG: hypothetical protein NTX59_05435 [Elusimicrobia bacterium]|nr:hypothetical protein [Elusimicrobiota bacterium]